MGFMKWLLGYDEEAKEEAEPQTRAETTITPQIDDVLLQAILNGETIDRQKALTIPAVSGAVDFIGNCVATMPVKLYKVKQGKVEEVENDPRVKLLNCDTHDTLDPFQFKKAMVEDYLMGRGGYAYIQRNRNEVTGLFYVEDIYISILYNYKPIHKDFEIIVQGETYQPYEFIKLLRNTKTGAEGTGLTLEVSKALETAYNTLTYQLGLVQSGGNKKGFLLSERRLGQDEINTLKNAWANMYANNTENVVVLNQGLKFQESSNSSVEMQLDQNKKTLTDEINNIFHIHPDDFEQTFKEAIYPIVKAFETALNRDLLLEKEKKNMFFEFDVKEIVRANLKDRYESYKMAKDTGFLTINEIRRAENLNYIEGMDVINVGLSAVLYDTNTHTYYTPNTDTKTTVEEETIEEMPTEEAVEEVPNDLQVNERFNHNHGEDGKFTTGSGGGSGSGSGGSGGGKSIEEKINELEEEKSKYSRFGEGKEKRKEIQAQIDKLKEEAKKQEEPKEPKSSRKPTQSEEPKKESKSENPVTPQKEEQFKIIKETNSMTDDVHTGIRKPSDIKSPTEAFKTKINDNDDYLYPDFTKADGEKALQTGKVTIYSSKPIENGGFVSPSKMMAQDYAGGGKVYSKTVNIDDVAWIDSNEGQFAQVNFRLCKRN